MAHGTWIERNDILLVALWMGTTMGWGEVLYQFKHAFPDSPANSKDLESRFNKQLRDEPKAMAVDDFRHSGVLPLDNPEHLKFILEVIVILSMYPKEIRLF
jgi:hypothetical protein